MNDKVKQERIIFHCDANSFYASVETASRDDLKGKPVAVSGNPATRTGIILTKNEMAKKYGVKTGEPIFQALAKCPSLICLAPHYKLYEEYSQKLRAIYEKYTDRVESFGIDECWLDVTDTVKFFGGAKNLANKIRQEVKDTLDITISVGVSFGKLLAKLGSDLKKPDATTIIDKDNYKQVVYSLPITSVIGIGKRLEARFNKIGVFTLGQIVDVPDKVLKKKFGIIGTELKQKLSGYDDDIVELYNCITPPKSVGNGTTTIIDIYTRKEVLDVVCALADEVSTRLRQGGFGAKRVSLTLKTALFKHLHSTIALPFATNCKGDLVSACMEIADQICAYNQPLRAVRICAYNLTSASEKQLSVFEDGKNEILSKTIDSIREKYGYFAITSASLIKNSTLDKAKVEV